MKKYVFPSLIAICLLMTISCSEEQAPLPSESYGLVSFGLSFSIEEIPTGRVESVSADDFKVTIFDDNGIEVLIIPRFANAPDSISLPVGSYYAEANSNNSTNASFENPYYFGQTPTFSVSQNSSQSVTIDVTQANSEVSFSFSQNVVDEFFEYTGTVSSDLTGDSLFYATGETRSGYFAPGPLSIKVNLKFLNTDGSLLEKELDAQISDALPKTHYQINVNASVRNGQIEINVDQDADSVDIDLNNNILALLDVSENAYRQAFVGDWVRITASEYDLLATRLQNINQSGAVDSLYSNTNLTFPGTQFTFVNDIGTTVPSGDYLFAFKYNCNSAVPAFEAEVKLSEDNITGSYRRVGQALPSHPAGENFFVLKGNAIKTEADAHLALYSRSAIGYTLGNSVGRYFFESGNRNVITNLGGAPGLVLAFQGLSSDHQY